MRARASRRTGRPRPRHGRRLRPLPARPRERRPFVRRCGLELEREVEPERAQELDCPGEQRERGPAVQAVVRAPAGGGEPRGGALGERGVGLAELCLVAGGLLEVVADDLVALDEGVAVLVEPGGEARVQVGADRLGEGVVGGVADQQVAEAVAVVARELGAVGADQLAAHEPGQPGRHLRLLGGERLHGAAMEDLALDGASLEHLALGLVELVEAGRQQRLQRRAARRPPRSRLPSRASPR